PLGSRHHRAKNSYRNPDRGDSRRMLCGRHQGLNPPRNRSGALTSTPAPRLRAWRDLPDCFAVATEASLERAKRLTRKQMTYNMSDKEQIQCQLARLGLRSAHPSEAGWYVTVEVYTFPGRETRKVWATDSVLPGGP